MSSTLKAGFTTASAVTIWTLLEFLAGLHTTHFATGLWTGLGALIVALVLIWRFVKQWHRAETSASYIKTAFQGIMISCVASALYGLFLLLYFTTINPDFYGYLEGYIRERSVAPVNPSVLEQRIAAAKASYAPINQFLTSVVGGSLLGGLYSLLVAAILRQHLQKPAPKD